jgi:hypothetical protein
LGATDRHALNAFCQVSLLMLPRSSWSRGIWPLASGSGNSGTPLSRMHCANLRFWSGSVAPGLALAVGLASLPVALAISSSPEVELPQPATASASSAAATVTLNIDRSPSLDSVAGSQPIRR